MMLRCGTGPVATRKASTASIFLDPSFRVAEFFGLVQGSRKASLACSLRQRDQRNSVGMTLLAWPRSEWVTSLPPL